MIDALFLVSAAIFLRLRDRKGDRESETQSTNNTE